MRSHRFHTLCRTCSAVFCLGVSALGCVGNRGAQDTSSAVPRRGEDLRLHARLGGPTALSVLATEWAHETEARTHTPYDASVVQAQAWLHCAVHPDVVRAKGPAQPLSSPADEEAMLGRIADLQRALYRLRITTPEGRELVQGVQRCVASHRSQ